MKDTSKSFEIMYARLRNKHKVAHTRYNDDIKYTLQSDDYAFISNLWLVCDTMKQWDELVEKYIKLFM